MTKKTCGTCRHWNTRAYNYRHQPGLGACDAIPRRSIDTPEETPACSSTYDADPMLETRADFGCTLHEPKETP